MGATIAEMPTSKAIQKGDTYGFPELAAQCAERASFYRLLGQLYFAPLSQAQIDALDVDAFHGISANCDNPLAAEGYNDMYRFLRHKDTGTRQVLNVDFTGAFYGVKTYEGLTAEPYESLYTNAAGTLMGPARTSVHREMAHNGIKVTDGIDLPDDHLTFELEYLAMLCERCQAALEVGDRAEARNGLKAQRTFLETHVLAWFTRFYNLSNKLLETRFYRGVNKIARAFLDDELATIDMIDTALA